MMYVVCERPERCEQSWSESEGCVVVGDVMGHEGHKGTKATNTHTFTP